MNRLTLNENESLIVMIKEKLTLENLNLLY